MISDIQSDENDYRLLRKKNLPRSLHLTWILKVPQKTLPCIPNTDVITTFYLQDVIFQKMIHEKHPQRTVLVKTPCNVHKIYWSSSFISHIKTSSTMFFIKNNIDSCTNSCTNLHIASHGHQRTLRSKVPDNLGSRFRSDTAFFHEEK